MPRHSSSLFYAGVKHKMKVTKSNLKVLLRSPSADANIQHRNIEGSSQSRPIRPQHGIPDREIGLHSSENLVRTRFALLSFCLTPVFIGCAARGRIQWRARRLRLGSASRATCMGGQRPISGAHVYLMEINPGGNGSPSISLLNGNTTGLVDSIGAYVLSDKNGTFSLPSTYACSPQNQVYLYSVGGDAGRGARTPLPG